MRLYAVVDGDDPGVAIPPKRDSPSPLEDDEGTLDSCETEAVPRAEAAPSDSPTGDPVEEGLADLALRADSDVSVARASSACQRLPGTRRASEA